MKREFGKRLIESYFAHEVELTEVIDTSGAYVPGHGTPTVILVGRRRGGNFRTATIRAVRSIQGEPSVPENAEDGLVWNALAKQIEFPGSVSQWVSVDDLERERYFGKQPWVLTNGGLELVEQLQHSSASKLSEVAESIGFAAITGDDEYFVLPRPSASWLSSRPVPRRSFVTGDQIRDWNCLRAADVVFPSSATPVERTMLERETLWPGRQILRNGLMFSTTKEQRGLPWSNYAYHHNGRLGSEFLITFPFVATHNHFWLGRGGSVFNRHAPVIKLREEASESEYLRILGLLNSSTAGLWLKMVSHSKGTEGHQSGIKTELWEQFYEFTGTKLQEFPLPSRYPMTLAVTLDSLGQQLSETSPSVLATKEVTFSAALLHRAHDTWRAIRARMISLQEELDWQVYSLYHLHPEDLRVSESPDSPDIPEIALGERAFEIVLARRVAAGEASGEWFKRHGSTPITEIPSHWPAAYREVVQKRIDAIESSRAIGMIERPEYKRRWAADGWDTLQEKTLRSWLLNRIEDRAHWFDENGTPALITLSRLIDNLSRDEDFVSVAKIYAPHKELPAVVSELMTDEHVPFLAALRYKPAALKKRADWEHVWDLQRQEDAAPDEPAKRKIRDSIPVPPKYTSADFLRPSYWRARGKLDVPKERFISYARANVATPDLYGWAGWDHREQAIALDTYIATHEGLTTEEVTPLLAGLLELQPWLNQWHNEPDPLFAPTPAKFFEGDRQMEQGKHGLTDDDLRAWRPAAATRGRRTTKK
jgi:hypothetical protein